MRDGLVFSNERKANATEYINVLLNLVKVSLAKLSGFKRDVQFILLFS